MAMGRDGPIRHWMVAVRSYDVKQLCVITVLARSTTMHTRSCCMHSTSTRVRLRRELCILLIYSRTTSSFSSMHPPSLEYYYAKEYPYYPYQHVQNLLLALVMDTT